MDDWEHRIFHELGHAKVMLVVLSPNYFKGPYCRKEWERYTDFAQPRPYPSHQCRACPSEGTDRSLGTQPQWHEGQRPWAGAPERPDQTVGTRRHVHAGDRHGCHRTTAGTAEPEPDHLPLNLDRCAVTKCVRRNDRSSNHAKGAGIENRRIHSGRKRLGAEWLDRIPIANPLVGTAT